MTPFRPFDATEDDIHEFALAKLAIPCKHRNSDAAYRRGGRPRIDITRLDSS
jgi:hypothetical protein